MKSNIAVQKKISEGKKKRNICVLSLPYVNKYFANNKMVTSHS